MVKVASGFPNFLSLTHLNLYEGGGKKRAPTYAKRRLYWASWSCSLRWRLAGYEETVGEIKNSMNRKGICASKLRWNWGWMACFCHDLLGQLVIGGISLKNLVKKDGSQGTAKSGEDFAEILGLVYKAMNFYPPWFLFKTRFSTQLSPFV